MLPSDWLQQIRDAYPKRIGGQGWGHVKKRIPVLIKAGESFDDMLNGCKAYSKLLKATDKHGTEFVMQARTFFGPGEWWLEDYLLPSDEYVPRKPEVVTDEMRAEDLKKFDEQIERFKSRGRS